MESMILLDHLVLGLIREEEGMAAQILNEMGAFYEDVLAEIPLPIIKHHDAEMTEQAKKSLELALREALALGHNYIGTEHILLGIARTKATSGDMIAHFSSDLIRKYVMDFLATPQKKLGAKDRLRAEPVPEAKFASGDLMVDALNTIYEELQAIRKALESN